MPDFAKRFRKEVLEKMNETNCKGCEYNCQTEQEFGKCPYRQYDIRDGQILGYFTSESNQPKSTEESCETCRWQNDCGLTLPIRCNYIPSDGYQPKPTEAEFIPCPSCGKLILRNKQRCPYCQSTLIYQQRCIPKPTSANEVKEEMPIVNPHNEETSMRDDEKVQQRDADQKVPQVKEQEWQKNQEALLLVIKEKEKTAFRQLGAEFETQKQEWKDREADWLEHIGKDLLCNACGEEDCGFGRCELREILNAHIAELHGTSTPLSINKQEGK